MNKFKMLIAFAAALISGNALAQKLAAQDVAIAAGSTADLVLSLDATQVAASAQLYITLPEGIEIAKVDGEYDYTIGDLLTKTHTVAISDEADGSVRVLIYKADPTATLKAASGTLLTLPLQAASDLKEGELQGQIAKIKFVDKEANTIFENGTASFKITVSAPTGISGISASQLKNGEVFDLNGKKVSTVKKGVYVVNGKKVVVK